MSNIHKIYLKIDTYLLLFGIISFVLIKNYFLLFILIGASAFNIYKKLNKPINFLCKDTHQSIELVSKKTVSNNVINLRFKYDNKKYKDFGLPIGNHIRCYIGHGEYLFNDLCEPKLYILV